MNDSLTLAKLRKNPFTLVPSGTVRVWAGYSELRETLLDIVESCRSDKVGLSEFTILHGDIGAGKSHALRYFRHWITEERGAEFVAPVLYLESLKLAAKMDFVEIYRRAIGLLLDHIKETAEWLDLVIDNSISEADRKREAEFKKKKDELYSDPTVTPEFPALAGLLRGIGNNDRDAIDILCGSTRKNLPLGEYHMTSVIDNDFDAIKCLGAYVNLCTRGAPALSEGEILGRNKAFYFFLDEIEMLQDFKPQEVLSINQGIRDLVNACPENCCFLFGMTGDTRLIFAIFDKFVMRRMSREPVEIPPLDVDQAVRFLKDVLHSYRSDESVPHEYPFREAALRRIAQETTEKTAAGLFRCCRRILERSVLTGRLEPNGWIEEEDVEELL